jgi:hypothetical protein
VLGLDQAVGNDTSQINPERWTHALIQGDLVDGASLAEKVKWSVHVGSAMDSDGDPAVVQGPAPVRAMVEGGFENFDRD